MDKIDKALNRLNKKERVKFKKLLLQIESGNLHGLDLKRLKGRDDVFRIRRGNMRIIFSKTDNNIKILSLERRNSKTYRK